MPLQFSSLQPPLYSSTTDPCKYNIIVFEYLILSSSCVELVFENIHAMWSYAPILELCDYRVVISSLDMHVRINSWK